MLTAQKAREISAPIAAKDKKRYAKMAKKAEKERLEKEKIDKKAREVADANLYAELLGEALNEIEKRVNQGLNSCYVSFRQVYSHNNNAQLWNAYDKVIATLNSEPYNFKTKYGSQRGIYSSSSWEDGADYTDHGWEISW
jgi:hypothetical protein